MSVELYQICFGRRAPCQFAILTLNVLKQLANIETDSKYSRPKDDNAYHLSNGLVYAMKVTKKTFILLFTSLLWFTTSLAQNYERYKKLEDTSISSTNLGFEKQISVVVPIEWQKGIENNFPLIIIFDSQNQRSHDYIVHTIDYLTSTEQIPSSVIISVASEERYRFMETRYKISDSNGLALANEKFIFEEMIPLAEKQYNASSFRIFIGHSRYGYFTTSLFHSRINELNAVIAMSPFFFEKNIDLTDSIRKLNRYPLNTKKYYRYAIGNDYPEDFAKMNAITTQVDNPFLNMKGFHFKDADHSTTPGLLISTALYEIFEDWSFIQSKYISNELKDLSIKTSLEKEIVANYGEKLNFSMGILNGKGWYFYNENQFEKAIEAWQILMDGYPNLSEGYLYMIYAQIQLNQNYSNTVQKFKNSLAHSNLYTEEEKKEMEEELIEIMK